MLVKFTYYIDRLLLNGFSKFDLLTARNKPLNWINQFATLIQYEILHPEFFHQETCNRIQRKMHFSTLPFKPISPEMGASLHYPENLSTRRDARVGGVRLLHPSLPAFDGETSFWKVGQERLVARAGTRSSREIFARDRMPASDEFPNDGPPKPVGSGNVR